MQGAFALALQTFNGKKGFYFTKKSYHKTVSFCHEAEGCDLLYILRRERMIAAVIDIGSNTMRMSVYKIEGQKKGNGRLGQLYHRGGNVRGGHWCSY